MILLGFLVPAFVLLAVFYIFPALWAVRISFTDGATYNTPVWSAERLGSNLGIYGQDVWTLDRVATPIADPYLLRAPFLDARPVPVSRRLKDG